MDTPGTGLRRRVTLSRMKSRMRFADGSLNFWFAGVLLAFSANSCGFLISVMGTNRCTQVIKRAPAAFRPSLRRSSRSGCPVMTFINSTTSSRLAGSLLVLSLLSILERTLDSGLKCVRMLSTKSPSSTFGLLDARIGKFSLKVCAISERAMFGRCSHSQLKSCNRDSTASSLMSCIAPP